jgi:hypothetical protein
MSEPFPKWSRVPGRVALLLGLGALSAAGARADVSHEPLDDMARQSQTERMNVGSMEVRHEAGRLYISGNGAPVEEIGLSDTPQARRLRQLLDQHGVVRLDRTILAGGGGTGFSWGQSRPVAPQGADNPAKSSDHRPASPASTRMPRQPGASNSGDPAGPENKK